LAVLALVIMLRRATTFLFELPLPLGGNPFDAVHGFSNVAIMLPVAPCRQVFLDD